MRHLRAIFILLALSTIAFAAGNYDVTFNGTGKLSGGFGMGNDFAASSAIQADGKIVIAGGADNGFDPKVFLARYNPDGTLDSSFGYGGSVLTDYLIYNGDTPSKPAVKLDTDGTILVLTGRDVMRFSATGALIKVFEPFTHNTWEGGFFDAIMLQSDGKVIAAGQYLANGSDNDALAVRYNADGSLDQSFGAGGRMILTVPVSVEIIEAIAVQADGNIVLVGSITGSGSYPLVIRLTADGRLDPRFNRYGSVIVAPGPLVGLSTIIQNDQKIVILGHNGYKFELVRLNPNGSIDTTFGDNGYVLQDSDNGSTLAIRFAKLVLQNDGKLVAAGYTDNGSIKLQAMRFEQNGSLDSSFGNGGIFVQSGAKPYSLALDSNQNLVFTGAAYMGDVLGSRHYDSLILRVNPSGIADGAFGEQGKATLDVGNRLSLAVDVQTQADNKIIVIGGLSSEPQPNQFVPKFFGAARFNENGTPDLSFGGTGHVLYDLGARVTASVLQPDGKIILAGETNDLKFLVARLNTDGSRDTAFGINGVASADFGNTEAIVRAVALQSNGKIVAAGDVNGDFGLARFDQNGNLDPSFNSGGLALTNLQGRRTRSIDLVSAIAIQPDDKIIVSGTSTYAYPYYGDSALVRYNPNGDINYKFGMDGIVINPISQYHDSADSLFLQPDGKIVTAGIAGASNLHPTLVVSRYEETGGLDQSFGQSGTAFPEPNGWWFNGGYAVTAQNDGKLIFTGNTSSPKIGRLNPDGTIDLGWGTNGIFTFNQPNGGRFSGKLALDPEGRIVAVANWGTFTLIRLLAEDESATPILSTFVRK